MIVGAGPVGCTVAERAASMRGWKSVIVEKRSHIGGNCHDSLHESGVRIHNYGPHYFRTNNKTLVDYLSRFTQFTHARYVVKSRLGTKLFPFPINLTTLERFFERPLDRTQAEQLLEKIRAPIATPKNSEEYVLSRVGRELYEAFYLGYTVKQWGRHPSDLDPSVCGRIPVRLNRDERYCDHHYQITPRNGFTPMFAKMIRSPLIRVLLDCDYRSVRSRFHPRVATVYCGPVDEYFDFRLGRLPWRSLRFEFQAHGKPFVQPCVQINYPSEHLYTRSVEIKHITRQEHPMTVVCYEYPTDEGDPYYPVPCPQSRRLHEQYVELSETETRERRVYFGGRLAQYRYMNMDEAFETGLTLFCRIESEYIPQTH